MDGTTALARLGSARVARLATVRPDGRPHVVPLVFALLPRAGSYVAYWVVDAKPKRSADLQRIRNLEAEPRAELLADGYEEDWSALWWVRASVVGRAVHDADERRDAWQALVEKYPQYRAARPFTRTFALEVVAVHAWSADGR